MDKETEDAARADMSYADGYHQGRIDGYKIALRDLEAYDPFPSPSILSEGIKAEERKVGIFQRRLEARRILKFYKERD